MRFTSFTGPKSPTKHGKNAKIAKSTRVCPPTGGLSLRGVAIMTVLGGFGGSGEHPTLLLSGPVLRDTARLSQRYPPIAHYGVLVSQHNQLGVIPPPPFLSVSPFQNMRSGGAKWRCDTPLQKGYLSDTCAIAYENKANGCDTPLCDTISKGYCGTWGVSRTGPLSPPLAYPTKCSTMRQPWRFWRSWQFQS